MLPNDTRSKIENIVAGVILKGSEDNCTTIRNTLCSRFTTSTVVKTNFASNAIIKEEQASFIEAFCRSNNLWIENSPPDESYLTRGGEAKIYFDQGRRHVIKLNDAVYYATWLEFLNSLLLHNLLFTNTSYELKGFLKQDDVLYAVLKQPFVIATTRAELTDIRKLLEFNEFRHTKRNDYANKELGLILEDMHDENVLVNSDTLFFIDTVFYTVAPEKE